MADEWFCQIDDAIYGPFSSHDLKRMAKTGKLKRADLVRKGEAGKWTSAGKAKGLVFELPKVTAKNSPKKGAVSEGRACPECEAVLQADADCCPVCGFAFPGATKRAKTSPLAAVPKKRSRMVIVYGGLGGVGLVAASVAIYFFVLSGPNQVVPKASDGQELAKGSSPNGQEQPKTKAPPKQDFSKGIDGKGLPKGGIPNDKQQPKGKPPLEVKPVAPQSGRVGPWEFRIVAFETKEDVNLDPQRRLIAKTGNVFAVVKVSFRLTRKLTDEEQAANKNGDLGKKVTETLIALGEKIQPFLYSTDIRLMWVQNRADGQKLMFSSSRICVSVQNDGGVPYSTISFLDCDVAQLRRDESELLLAFEYDAKDQNPVLTFGPTPESKETAAGRIAFQKDGKVTVEYGSLEQMGKYLPKELKAIP